MPFLIVLGLVLAALGLVAQLVDFRLFRPNSTEAKRSSIKMFGLGLGLQLLGLAMILAGSLTS